jgi:hypothetical protein
VFVRHTYTLEGDGVLVFWVIDLVVELRQHVQAVRQGGAMTPNTRAVATAIVDAKFGADLQAAKDAKVAQLIAEQLKKVEPSFVYFEQKMQELAPMLDIFRVARLFDPSRIGMLAINANEVERQLKLLPFVDAPKVANLMAGLPAYLARAAAHLVALNADSEPEIEAWWEAANAAGLTAWCSVAIQVMILQPSSAAAERVFSMLKAIMGDQQQARSLEDYQEAAIMTRYNELQRNK